LRDSSYMLHTHELRLCPTYEIWLVGGLVHLDPEDGGSKLLRNVSTHLHEL